jgi:hypothetical protein
MLRNLLGLSFFLFSYSALSQVWPHSAQWNENYETQYSHWVANEIKTDFLTRPGQTFSGFKIDCADLHYLLRIIFSSQNGLEFAINDPTTAGQIISSRNPKWLKIQDPEDRLRKFATYVLNNTSTRTLPNDTVLVAIDKKSIRPGVILLGDRDRGHSMLIKKINPSGVPVLYYASLPASEFIYASYFFPEAHSYFPMGSLSLARGGGFRKFKWPEDIRKSPHQISYASEDQLKAGSDLNTYFEVIQEALRIQAASPSETISYLMEDLCMQVRVRTNTTTDAYHFLKNRPAGKTLSSAEEDRYSTHHRDESIRVLWARLTTFFTLNEHQISNQASARFQSLRSPEGSTADECLVEWAVNRLEPLGWILERFDSNKISSEADATLSERWGLVTPLSKVK